MDMLAMQLVRSFGAEVLDSPEFEQAMAQKHHHVTTVGDHSLGVAYTSVKICRFLNAMHIKTDTKAVIRGALCHDLGIVGRYEKFSNNQGSCRFAEGKTKYEERVGSGLLIRLF